MFDSRQKALRAAFGRYCGDVLTVVDTPLQRQLNLVLGEAMRPIHLESVAAAIMLARKIPVRAVLLGPEAIGPELSPDVATLSNLCVGGMMIAVIKSSTPALAERLLAFGGVGVRDAVDMSNREGLNRLRTLLTRDEWHVTHRIAMTLHPSFEVATNEMRYFVDHLIRFAPFVSTIRALAGELRVRDSSLVSRFYRAGLPSPKKYLAATRLLYASAVLETPSTSVAQTALRLRYASPQSFGRQVRKQLGVAASQFRDQFPFDVMANRFADHLVVQYRCTLQWFEPLGGKTSNEHGVDQERRVVAS